MDDKATILHWRAIWGGVPAGWIACHICDLKPQEQPAGHNCLGCTERVSKKEAKIILAREKDDD